MLKFQNKRDNSLQNEVYMFSLWSVVLFVIYLNAYEVVFFLNIASYSHLSVHFLTAYLKALVVLQMPKIPLKAQQ